MNLTISLTQIGASFKFYCKCLVCLFAVISRFICEKTLSKHLKLFLFSDDTNIYLEDSNLNALEKVMNKELKKLYEWLCINRLSLNITKTNFVIFHAINKPKFPITIVINKHVILSSLSPCIFYKRNLSGWLLLMIHTLFEEILFIELYTFFNIL